MLAECVASPVDQIPSAETGSVQVTAKALAAPSAATAASTPTTIRFTVERAG